MCGKVYTALCMQFLCPGKVILSKIPLFFGQYSGARFTLPPIEKGEILASQEQRFLAINVD